MLSRKNYLEADRILVVFSKDYGKLTLLAKGVRKPKSRKRGSVEVFNYIKFAASRGKGFDIVTEVEMIDSFSEIRSSLKKASVAYFFLEATNRLTQEGEKNEKLFLLVIEYLGCLGNANNLKNLRKKFIYEVLVLLGFWPRNKTMNNHDQVIEKIAEREMFSIRVGRKMLT